MSRYKSNNTSNDSLFKDSGDEGEGERDMLKEGLWNHINQLREMCKEKERVIKKLKVELKLSKSPGRNTKQKIRTDYQWDGEDANLADKVSDWVKTYLSPRYKVFKKGVDGIFKQFGQLVCICQEDNGEQHSVNFRLQRPMGVGDMPNCSK